MATIGFIGSGNIGTALARAAISVGHQVVMSNSRGPQTLGDLIADLGPQASAASAEQAAERGDWVVVTIPLKAYAQVPVAPLAGKTVVDTNNYYPERDGHFAELDAETTTTAELLAAHLPEADVVKAFNHIYFEDIAGHAAPAGSPDRRALAIAGDDGAAKATVATFVDQIGFDVLDLGPLAEGWRTQRDTPAYVTRFTLAELQDAVGRARRYADLEPSAD